MTDCKTPCGDCPFSRKTTPGKLGGSAPEVYAGQIVGPYRLPCHQHYESREQAFTAPQCAGAAIFRANIGVSARLPQPLHRLPPDGIKVFTSMVEFYAHHKRISPEVAALQLIALPPEELLAIQMARPTNVTLKTED